jgi:two-component system, chemotaxis family, chemotaxis protein CheY
MRHKLTDKPRSSAHLVPGLLRAEPVPHPLPTLFPGARSVRYFRPGQQASPGGSPGEEVSRNVLIVEDEPYLCDLISDVLESDGHSTRKAGNGLEALRFLQEQTPDLILLDLMMPVMDGWEFMTELRARDDWKDIPVVIITAVYDVARTQFETGASGVITKPFDIDQLSDIVRYYAR